MTGWKVHGLVELGLTMVSLVCAAIPTASMARDKVQVVTYMWYKGMKLIQIMRLGLLSSWL